MNQLNVVSDEKSIATATARCALIGATLHVLPDESGRTEFIVSRWHLTKAFFAVTEVEAWLDRVEGRKS